MTNLHLEPCPVPWCGGDAEMVCLDYAKPPDYYAECRLCMITGPSRETPEDAAEEWNNRPAAVPVEALREFIRDRRVLNWDERADVANGVLRALEHLANQYDREAERREVDR